MVTRRWARCIASCVALVFLAKKIRPDWAKTRFPFEFVTDRCISCPVRRRHCQSRRGARVRWQTPQRLRSAASPRGPRRRPGNVVFSVFEWDRQSTGYWSKPRPSRVDRSRSAAHPGAPSRPRTRTRFGLCRQPARRLASPPHFQARGRARPMISVRRNHVRLLSRNGHDELTNRAADTARFTPGGTREPASGKRRCDQFPSPFAPHGFVFCFVRFSIWRRFFGVITTANGRGPTSSASISAIKGS